MIIKSSRLGEGYRQVKIYADGYVMWTRQVPNDSLEWYGFGKYEIRGDTLVENLEYGSHTLMNLFKSDEHIFFLVLDKDRYSQIDYDAMGNFKASENYIRVEEWNFLHLRVQDFLKERITGNASNDLRMIPQELRTKKL